MSDIIYQYHPKNTGDHIPGVPMRDLTQADVDALDLFALREVLACDNPDGGLYVKVEPPKFAPKKASVDTEHAPESEE